MDTHGAQCVSGEAPSTSYVVPKALRSVMLDEIDAAMEEYDMAMRAPLRVVALGRSGVGKSHVLNQLLSELASRDDSTGKGGAPARTRATRREEMLVVTSMTPYDEKREEREANTRRTVEDEGTSKGVSLDAGAREFPPPPPLDRNAAAELYVPRHMRARGISGAASKMADAVQIRKDKLKSIAKANAKKGTKTKPSYVIYKQFHEEKAKERAEKSAKEERREMYEKLIGEFKIPIREKEFPKSHIDVASLVEDVPGTPFLLPEGNVMDTTSVACSVSTSDSFRVTLVYFDEDTVKKHVHALRHEALIARSINEYIPTLGPHAKRAVHKQMKAEGMDELTMLDIRKDNKEDGDDAQYALASPLRVACAMVGLSPNLATLKDVQDDDVTLPAHYLERLGQRVVFEYKPDDLDALDYSDESTFRRALVATRRTLVTQTHLPSACWGLLREVRVEIPTPERNRGLVLIDAPGAGDADPARDRHLVAALRNAAAVICLGDSREVTNDVARALHKSGFLQQLVLRPATRRLINAVQGDLIWGRTDTTFRKARECYYNACGRVIDVEDLAAETPPTNPEFQWAIDQVIKANTQELATVRRAELLRMLTDPDGSVGEIHQTSNAIISVAWKFIEIRSSWAKVFDVSTAEGQSVTGHGALYRCLEDLKLARRLKIIRRATRRVHTQLEAFRTCAEPLHLLPKSDDDALRGFHDDLEFSLGEGGAYAARKMFETATKFCLDSITARRDTVLKKLDDRVKEMGRPTVVREVLSASAMSEDKLKAVTKSQDVHNMFVELVGNFEDAIRAIFTLRLDGSGSKYAPHGMLYAAVSDLVDHWHDSIISNSGDSALTRRVKDTFANLAGDEKDPQRATLRSLLDLSLRKFKLSAARSRGYINISGGRKEHKLRLWNTVSRAIASTMTKQTKAILTGLTLAYDGKGYEGCEPTPEGVLHCARDSVSLLSLCACTLNDVIMESVEVEIIKWFQTHVNAAAEDHKTSIMECILPYVKKQVMPEFRALVAKPSMLKLIHEDVKSARSLGRMTEIVLGDEAKPAISRADKLQKILTLAKSGREPVQMCKKYLDKPASVDWPRAPDDAVEISLDEFPLRIFLPNLEGVVTQAPTVEATKATEEVEVPAPTRGESPVPVANKPPVVEEETETPKADEEIPAVEYYEEEEETEPQPESPPKQNSSSKSDLTATASMMITKEKAVEKDDSLPLLSGMCDHCGATQSTIWMKGTTKKPNLCQACGTFYIRSERWLLPDLKTMRKVVGLAEWVSMTPTPRKKAHKRRSEAVATSKAARKPTPTKSTTTKPTRKRQTKRQATESRSTSVKRTKKVGKTPTQSFRMSESMDDIPLAQLPLSTSPTSPTVDNGDPGPSKVRDAFEFESDQENEVAPIPVRAKKPRVPIPELTPDDIAKRVGGSPAGLAKRPAPAYDDDKSTSNRAGAGAASKQKRNLSSSNLDLSDDDGDADPTKEEDHWIYKFAGPKSPLKRKTRQAAPSEDTDAP